MTDVFLGPYAKNAAYLIDSIEGVGNDIDDSKCPIRTADGD